MAQVLDLDGTPLRNGEVFVQFAGETKSYKLDEEGRPGELINTPVDSRIVYINKDKEIVMDGRLRQKGNHIVFKPARRMRKIFGDQLRVAV